MAAKALGRSGASPRLHRALGQAARHCWLSLAVYLSGLLVALLAGVPVLVGSVALAALGPWLEQIAAGDYLAFLIEIAGSAAAAATLGGSTPSEIGIAGASVGFAILFAAVSLLLHTVLYTLIVGGVLARLAGASSGSFWADCRRWFAPMFRYGLLAVPAFVTLVTAGALLVGLVPGTSEAAGLAKLIVLGLWVGLVNGALELGRADMVVRSDPAAASAFGRVARLLVSGESAMPAVLTWLGLGVVAGGFWLAGAATVWSVPATSLLSAIVAEQAVALLGAWLKVLRLAIAVELARGLAPAPTLAEQVVRQPNRDGNNSVAEPAA
ncbi:MAG: hypothetical protein HY329_15260 [Chloroflexi bacterium]|nr:hypothetical protein [Chloroflexota bacterium]